MRIKKIPLRICIGCRERKEKRALIRIVKTPQGNIEIDPTGKKSGRGAYVCPQPGCVELLRRKDLSLAFRIEVKEGEFSALKEVLSRYVKNLRKEDCDDQTENI